MNKKKNSEEAYESIRKLILSVEIHPGQSVTEHSLSEHLGMGRTPVREALAKLEAEGLIFSQNGRKTVYVLTIDEIKEIFDIKYALEGAMAYWAAERGSAAEKRKLNEIMERMVEFANKRPENEEERERYLSEWTRHDKDLHRQIFIMAKSPKAQKIIENLNVRWFRTRISMYAIEGRIVRSSKEHQKFVNYIVSGEPEKAEEAMKEHLATIKKEIEQVMKLFNYPVQAL
ncbi:GntR family transcriptional regulator [Flammeovirgaceae bacterium 311]|nr:GntR family transcriptional regulator [Flammeovirgaceae bacterium 311]